MSSNIIDKVFGLSPQVLKIRAQRSEVIASNLANVDTPHYKAKDIDFAQAISGAIAGNDSGKLTRTDSKHLTSQGSSEGMPADTLYRVPTQPSMDGNTVEAHREHMAFMDNAVRYQASLNFMNSKIRGMLLAIKGD